MSEQMNAVFIEFLDFLSDPSTNNSRIFPLVPTTGDDDESAKDK